MATIETGAKPFYQENSGIAIVAPAEKISEIIYSKKFEDELKAVIDEAKKTNK